VLSVEPTGSRSVNWAEFVEAGLLRQYRRVNQVPLPELPKMIDIWTPTAWSRSRIPEFRRSSQHP